MVVWASCECSWRGKLRPELAGRRIRCPQCGAGIVVPQPEGDSREWAEAGESGSEVIPERISATELPPVVPEVRSEFDEQRDQRSAKARTQDQTRGSGPIRRLIDGLRTRDEQQKPWWRICIDSGKVRESRYPALTAYRNLMIWMWWVVAIATLLVAIACPFVIIGTAMSSVWRNNSRVDSEHALLFSDAIQAAERKVAAGQGLSAAEAVKLIGDMQAAVDRFDRSYLHSGPNGVVPNSIRQYEGSPVPAAQLKEGLHEYLDWADGVDRSLDERRESMTTTVLIAILVTIVAELSGAISFILVTISMLMPPDLIRLIMDVESGIRGRAN